ncbi:hypothetical protein GCM10028803_28480 [Larkinella knui]|uniref:Uncharacterized protein n=1 Tax=Larkinella knui TaxID=2025310 RepID=A0A3P1CXU0_9BACT|nr:PKD domain-containing protein [Larkinella knui]RRB17886.1 hypothetical protein EHT87_06315 [Larkinella knui]
MTPVSPQRPIPLGELLEQLRLEGFAVTPEVYDRCFRVAGVYFPTGWTESPDGSRPDRTLRELKEVLGPVVARSDIEQEKFGLIFDQVLTRPSPETGELKTTVQQKSPGRRPWFWGLLLAAMLLTGGGIGYFIYQPPPVVPVPQPADSTNRKLPDPNCLIKVSVASIVGNQVTFLNQSPGLKLHYAYKWDFDGTKPVIVTTDSTITHTFPALTASTVVTIALQDGGCDQTFLLTNLYRTNQPTLESFPLVVAAPSLHTTYAINRGSLLLAVLLGTGLFGVISFRYFFTRRKVRPSDSPPYFLTFPDQEKTIKVAGSMEVWARQLNQREEGQRRVMDIARTIRATARMGGYPAIYYQQIKLRPRYLVLIDNRSTFHQQARLYAYLGTVLMERDVELELFFFNADPRTCWNEKYPKGIAIGDLYRIHRASQLVLITEGVRLLDYEKGTVASWVTNLFDGWEKRAILTPVYAENWTYIEALLSRFFIVLPATPEGQLLLRAYLQADELPTFQELLRRFQRSTDQVADRGFFGKSAEKLTIADIDQFLETGFEDENLTEPDKIRLKQWAYATAVYPTPTWEMTLTIGKALEQYYQTDTLVTTTNLLKISALPWLQQSRIPDPLRAALLDRLAEFPPNLQTGIQNDVLALLQSVKTVPGSMAGEEQEMHTYEVWLTDENRRPEALRKLAPFQKAGLITNRVVDRQVADHGRRQQLAYVLTLATAAVLLLISGYFILSQQPNRTSTGLNRFFYSRSDTTFSDSAVIYNNLAASVLDKRLEDINAVSELKSWSARIGYAFPRTSPVQAYSYSTRAIPESELYELRLAFVLASLRNRITFEALYNLHAIRYGYGFHLDSLPNRSATDVSRVVSPLGEVNQIVAPTSWFQSTEMTPMDTLVRQYVTLLNQNLPIDTIRQKINTLDSYGANLRRLGAMPPLTDQEINRAKQAGQFNRVSLLLPSQTGKNILRVRLPRLNTTPTELDSLARLDAARIRLAFRQPQLVRSEKPATQSPAPATARPKAKAVRKKAARAASSLKAPSKSRPYPVQTKTGSEEKPPTANRK